MKAVIIKVIHDCFTENDGVSWCLVRIGSVPVVTTMLVKLIIDANPDYLSFGGGVAAVWAAIAFKNKGETA